MDHPLPLTHAEIEQYVDAVRRRHGRTGLLVLAEICTRALMTSSAQDAPRWRQPISLVGP